MRRGEEGGEEEKRVGMDKGGRELQKRCENIREELQRGRVTGSRVSPIRCLEAVHRIPQQRNQLRPPQSTVDPSHHKGRSELVADAARANGRVVCLQRRGPADAPHWTR